MSKAEVTPHDRVGPGSARWYEMSDRQVFALVSIATVAVVLVLVVLLFRP